MSTGWLDCSPPENTELNRNWTENCWGRRTNMHQTWKSEIFVKFRGLSVVKNGITTLCWKLKLLIFQPTWLKIRLPRLVHAMCQRDAVVRLMKPRALTWFAVFNEMTLYPPRRFFGTWTVSAKFRSLGRDRHFSAWMASAICNRRREVAWMKKL